MRDDPAAVMIFAAGFGTRMGALTQDRPKPLVKVAGKPLIDHALDLIEDFGASPVVVNLHYKADLLRGHLEHRGVDFSEEQPDILDTGGGLKAALPLLGDGPCFTMNSDAVWHGPNPLLFLVQHWDPKEMDALLLCVPPENTVAHDGSGDFQMRPDRRLSRGPGQVYSGVQIVKPDLVMFEKKRVFSLNVVWDRAAERGRLFGASYPGRWCDVGHPAGIALAENMLEARDA